MEDIPQEMLPERHGTSRRDFIKRSAVTGAVVWSAPAISTLSSRAWAQTYVDCPCANEHAFAVKAFASVGGTVKASVLINEVGPDPETKGLDATVMVDDEALVSSRTASATVSECFAQATLEDLRIDLGALDVTGLDTVITASLLTATAHGRTCARECEVANLAIDGVADANVKITSETNLTVTVPGVGTLTVDVCEPLTGHGDGGTGANALHVSLVASVPLVGDVVVDIIISHAELDCCP